MCLIGQNWSMGIIANLNISTTHSISQNVCLWCCFVRGYIGLFLVDSSDLINHNCEGCITDTRDCPCTREVTLIDMGKICYYQNTIKHMKAQTVHIIFGMCCIVPVYISRVKPNHGMFLYLSLILSNSFRHCKTPKHVTLMTFFLTERVLETKWG